MRQFDVVANPDQRGASFAPFLVILSSHHLDLDLIVVAPMLLTRSVTEGGLLIAVVFQGRDYHVSIVELAGVPPSRLRAPLGSLSVYEDGLRRGVERLFTGF